MLHDEIVSTPSLLVRERFQEIFRLDVDFCLLHLELSVRAVVCGEDEGPVD